MKKRTGNWCELSFFRVNAIVSCGCNPFCRLVIHFVDKSRANYVWGVVAQQKGPSIPNYFLQCTSFEIVRFIQIYTQKTGKEILLISCNTYNKKGTASITKGTSWSQTDPTSQKGERFIGRALITQKWLRSGKNRPEKIQKIHKITCNSDSILRSVKVQIQKTSTPSVLLPTISHIFMSCPFWLISYSLSIWFNNLRLFSVCFSSSPFSSSFTYPFPLVF